MDGKMYINPNGFVCYYRVSTRSQSKPKAGDDPWWIYQQDACRDFLKARGAKIVGEFHEVASAVKGRRPVFAEAVRLCMETGATLFAARIDRLTRSVALANAVAAKGVAMEAIDHVEMPFKELLRLCRGLEARYADADRSKGEKDALDLLTPSQAECRKKLREVTGMEA